MNNNKMSATNLIDSKYADYQKCVSNLTSCLTEEETNSQEFVIDNAFIEYVKEVELVYNVKPRGVA